MSVHVRETDVAYAGLFDQFFRWFPLEWWISHQQHVEDNANAHQISINYILFFISLKPSKTKHFSWGFLAHAIGSRVEIRVYAKHLKVYLFKTRHAYPDSVFPEIQLLYMNAVTVKPAMVYS